MDPDNTQPAQPVIPVRPEPIPPAPVPVESVPIQTPVPPVQPATVQSTPPASTPSKSKLPLILGLIILLVVSAGILLAKSGGIPRLVAKPTPTPVPTQIPTPTPTVDPTSDWKTYTNTKYNYSIKYPVEWFIYDKGTYWPSEKIYKNKQEIVFVSPQQREDLTPGGFSLMNSLLIRGDLGAFIESDIDKNIYKTEQTTLGVLPVTKVVSIAQPAMGGLETHYNFSYKGKNYEIAFPNDDLSGTHNPVFDQILSTFRFD